MFWRKKGQEKKDKRLTREDVVRLLQLAGSSDRLDLKGRNLAKIDLTVIELHHANLSNANLSRANLSNANLTGADLSSAYLRGAILGGAILVDANLWRTNLGETDLRAADLSRAYLCEADLSNANLGKANLSEADLWRANLSKANLSGASLSDAELDSANLSGAKVTQKQLERVQSLQSDTMVAVKPTKSTASIPSAAPSSTTVARVPLASTQVSVPSPTDAESHNRRGNTLFDSERYEEALAAYDQAIALDPTNALFHDNRGNALRELKRYEEALLAHEQAIRLDPNDALAYNDKGNALSELERYEEALAAYEQAIRLDPNDALVYDNKGNALSELERYQEAIAAYEQAIRLDPTNAAYSSHRETVLRERPSAAKPPQPILAPPKPAATTSQGITTLLEVCSHQRDRLLSLKEDPTFNQAVEELKREGPKGAQALAALIDELLAARCAEIQDVLAAASLLSPQPDLVDSVQKVISAPPVIVGQPSRFPPVIIGGGKIGWDDGAAARIKEQASEVLAMLGTAPEVTAPKASSPQPTQAATTPASFQTFTNSDNSFRIAYPGDWQQEAAPSGSGSTFTSQDQQKVFIVYAVNLGTSQADPATAVSAACSRAGGTPSSPQTASIGGQSWTKAECDTSGGSNHLLVEAVDYKGNRFVIAYGSPKASFDNNASQFFTPMEQSFQFLSVKPAPDMNSCSYCGNPFQVLRPGMYLDTAAGAIGDIVLRTRKGCGACGIPVCFDCAASAADKKGLGGHCVCPQCGANLD